LLIAPSEQASDDYARVLADLAARALDALATERLRQATALRSRQRL
jgi:hypothetical protein